MHVLVAHNVSICNSLRLSLLLWVESPDAVTNAWHTRAYIVIGDAAS